MSVEPEPRQRTVAELLAENGGAQSGRRRRRRAVEDDDAGFEAGPPADEGDPPPPPFAGPGGPGGPPPRRPAADAPPNGRFAGGYAPEPQGPPPGGPANDHGPHGGTNGHEPNGYAAPNGFPPPNGNGANGFPAPNGYAAPNGHDRNGHDRNGYEGYAQPPAFPDHGGPQGRNGAAPPSPPQGRPGVPGPPPARRGPEPSPAGGMPQTPGPYGPPDRRPPEPESPTGAFGPRGYGGPSPDVEGGPPTQLGGPPLDDDDLDDLDERAWTGEAADEQATIAAPAQRRPAQPVDGGPPTQAGFGPDDLDDDYEDHGEYAAGVHDDPDEYRRGSRRRAAVAGLDDDEVPDDADGKVAGTGQAWAMVIAQWVGGAVVGAGVWVGFRYLWYSLPVVALALAVVLTVGLVLGVRALLRNDDLRTTMFAVLVGLLLTVSPALLVLLDR